ncbi:MAG: molybdopterin molybdotransferase MoeA [Methanobrevibacter sp.]|jgi:molybdopterin molybdotransferase|nr:molybdopterin molybdotransferase MoeA [Methanobrevibacter sp.]
MGTEFLKIKELEEAIEIIEKLFKNSYKHQSEEISLEESVHRVIFNDVEAKIDFPPFNRALKDGYAIKAEDSFKSSPQNPKSLKIIDSIEAGTYSSKTLEKGQAIEISTGAPIPEGSDAIAMVEHTERYGKYVNLLVGVTPNTDIAFKGSDIKKGDLILKKGSILSPGKIGALKAQGLERIEVFKKPKIGIISTGNELVVDKKDFKFSKIYDINSYSLKSAIQTSGGEGEILAIVKDNYDELKKEIKKGLEKYDILLSSGGTSAGRGDILIEVLNDLGKVHIHGISIKPGKPTIVGKIENKLVIGLPGNPVAALIVYYVLINPHVRKLSGLKESMKSKVKKFPLNSRLHSSKGRAQYFLVKIQDKKIYPIIKDSGAITSLAIADGYIKVPKEKELLEKGEMLRFYEF